MADVDPLLARLFESATLSSPEESKLFFEDRPSIWGETLKGEDSPTGEPIVHINEKKFKEALGQSELTPQQIQKYFLGETLHNLKDVEPETYNSLLEAALSNPAYRQWMKDSFELVKEQEGEKRDISDWHRVSRFDQIIGGYLFAGDPDYPTLKGWKKTHPGFQGEFGNQLEILAQRLGLSPKEVTGSPQGSFVDKPLYDGAF